MRAGLGIRPQPTFQHLLAGMGLYFANLHHRRDLHSHLNQPH